MSAFRKVGATVRHIAVKRGHIASIDTGARTRGDDERDVSSAVEGLLPRLSNRTL